MTLNREWPRWALLLLINTGCDVSTAPHQPGELSFKVREDRLSNVPAPAAYEGVITTGRFVICTSRFSPPALYHYYIKVENSLPSDRTVSEVWESNGECVVAFDTNRRGGPDPSIRVFADATKVPEAADLWDYRSLLRFVPGVGFLSTEIDLRAPRPREVRLQGTEGALVKFYYYPLSYSATGSCGHSASGISTQGVCSAGGHGGTGTFQMELD